MPLAFKQTFSSIIVILPLLELRVYNAFFLILINKSTQFYFANTISNVGHGSWLKVLLTQLWSELADTKCLHQIPASRNSKEIKRPNKVKTLLWEVKHVTITRTCQIVRARDELAKGRKSDQPRGSGSFWCPRESPLSYRSLSSFENTKPSNKSASA